MKTQHRNGDIAASSNFRQISINFDEVNLTSPQRRINAACATQAKVANARRLPAPNRPPHNDSNPKMSFNVALTDSSTHVGLLPFSPHDFELGGSL